MAYRILYFCLLNQLVSGHDLPGHSDDHTEESPAYVSDHRFFLQEIFTKYGHEGKMTFEGFEHLLESLGLGNIIITDHDVSVHKEDEFRNPHGTHDHSKKDHDHKHTTDAHRSTKSSKSVKTRATVKQATLSTTTLDQLSETNTIPSDDDHAKSGTEAGSKDAVAASSTSRTTSTAGGKNIYHYRLPDAEIPELLVNISSLVNQHQELENEPQAIVIEQCLSPREILETFGINQSSSLNPISFLHLCPAIIYELDQGHCMFRDMGHRRHKSLATPLQWLYTLLAVLIISLCGLLSVAVIPVMQKWFYHTLLQFLVGLAVGSLSGDALLHLMPHAMLTGDGGHGRASLIPEVAERTAVWRGFAALGGIVFFFIAERFLAAVTTKKEDTSKIVEKGAESDLYAESRVGQKLSHYRKDSNLELTKKEMMQMLAQTNKNSSELATHSHSHGHSHEVPQSVSAVAWMVIMGDGLHNFCDGLAIGAAFASGVEGGISTTVAVFCHELPHELGDFAMLLQTGMGVRRALLYNVLSSALCLAGAALGLCLGGVSSATGWVFAITAGIFLYVALVDMLPELSSSRDQNSSPLHQLAIQVLGISTGVSIMLIISNYEQDLQSLVS